MRAAIPVAGVTVLAVGFLGLGAAASFVGVDSGGSSSASAASCTVSSQQWGQQALADPKAQAATLDEEQRGFAALIISLGKQRDIPPRGWQVAIQAAKTESNLRNLNYGDRDSLGLFQMRPSQGWGSRNEVTDPMYAVNTFFDRMLQVDQWKQRRPGEVAQAVERSAFPARYHDWEGMAAHLVSNLGDVVNASGCGQPAPLGEVPAPTEAATTAIRYSQQQLGKPYEWGAEGPDEFDCSGLMMRAYESAGVVIPRVSRDQYNGGAPLPVRQAKAGDMLFWGYDSTNPATIHHVAMYVGNGRVLEAPREGKPVRVREMNWDNPGLMPRAVRPGV